MAKKSIPNPEEQIKVTVVFRRSVYIKRGQLDELQEKAKKLKPKNFDEPYFLIEDLSGLIQDEQQGQF